MYSRCTTSEGLCKGGLTMMYCLFWSLFLLDSITPSSIGPKPGSYLIAFPRKCTLGASNNFLVQFWADSEVHLYLSLQKGDQKFVVFDQRLARKLSGNLLTFTFELPDHVNPDEHQLHVTATGGVLVSGIASTSFVTRPRSKLLVQTDKRIYKPGQTVYFRILGINWDLKPLPQSKLLNISIMDGSGSRILQWTDLQLQQGLLSLNFSVVSRPVLGLWRISAEGGAGIYVEKTIEIAKTVLPKYEVTIKAPQRLALKDTLIPVEVCARYAHGQPTVGIATVLACMESRENRAEVVPRACTTTKKQMKGCDTVEMVISELELIEDPRSIKVLLQVSFAENSTNVVINSSTATAFLADSQVDISFLNTLAWYKPGSSLKVSFHVKPVSTSLPVPLYVNCSVTKGKTSYWVKVLLNNGVGLFQVPTNYNPQPITITIVYESPNVNIPADLRRTIKSHRIPVWFSPSSSYFTFRAQREPIQIGTTESILMDYRLNRTRVKSLNFMLFCLGRLRQQGEVMIHGQSRRFVRTGTLSIPVRIDKDASPVCRLLAMLAREDKEIVADSIELKIQHDLPKTVDVSFASAQLRPGEKTVLHIETSPGSRYAVTGTDWSFELHGAPAHFDTTDLLEYRMQTDLSNNWFHTRSCPSTQGRVIPGNNDPIDENSPGYESSSKAFRDLGLTLLTDLSIDIDACGPSSVMFDYEDEEATLPVRTDSPETWLWLDGEVNNDGSASVNVTVPDTITSWTIHGFAVSDVDGVGFAVPTSVKVFQPFFLSLTLPYSAVRMERVTLPLSIFNYLDSCLTIIVSIAPSDMFTVVMGQQGLFGIEAQKSGVYSFVIQPVRTGRATIRVRAQTTRTPSQLCANNPVRYIGPYTWDITEEKLLMEPRGIKRNMMNSTFICIQDTTHVEQLSIIRPRNAVPDSVHATVGVVGDIMGPSMSNIGELIRMPYGCGEQNMINFAPNIYILQYLQATGQNQEDVIKKAKNFMVQGYQKQLGYKRSDGSYAAFGEREPQGSTWLTAFVIKSYAQASPFIHIDRKDIDSGISYLLQKQNKDGCFIESGEVHDKFIMGGMNGDGTLLTAFVIHALLESGYSVQSPALVSGLECLVSKSKSITSPYGLAVLAHTLSSAKHLQAAVVIDQLWRKAITTRDGFTSWPSVKTTDRPTPYSWVNWQAKPSDIETAGYALLTTLKHYGKQEGINRSIGVIRWLTRQRNSLGGFVSTQDTCVAMQGLAAFSEQTFSSNTDVFVMIRSVGAQTLSFPITASNKLLLQKTEISVPVSLEVMLNGTGCALIQVAMDFSVLSVPPTRVFNLEVFVSNSQETPCSPMLTVCASYLLGEETNMALVEVHFWTGFTAVVEDLDRALVPGFNLQQFEVEGGKLTLYFSKLKKERTCITFHVISVVTATAIAPKPVLVYDYYDNQKITTVMKPYKKEYCATSW